MKITEIKELTLDELLLKESEIRKDLFHLRVQKRLGKLEKVSQLRSLRRELARVKTVFCEKFQGEKLK